MTTSLATPSPTTCGRSRALVQSVGLDDPGQGLTEDVLGDARVLIWWGHVRQREVKPEVGRKIVERVKAGTLALIALHSAHWSTPFIEAMNERARIDASKVGRHGARSRSATSRPPAVHAPEARRSGDPLLEARKFPDGVSKVELHLPYCCLPAYGPDGKPSKVLSPTTRSPRACPDVRDPQKEMYDEPFHVPEPDEVIFEERWEGGEWFRSGMVWTRPGPGLLLPAGA